VTAIVDHFVYGPVTPVLAYALSVLGSLLGLTCTAKARAATSPGRRAWFLLLAAWAIGGTGIWVMHFMAMLGFGVDGAEIRYDVPITTASAIIAISVVAVGMFTAGFGRPRPFKIILGGTFAGLGVAAMHYTGMAAMRLDGTVDYDRTLVAASIAIAVVAATVALWFTVIVNKPIAIIGSALVMGVAVSGMHYTAMFAMEVHLHGTGRTPLGATVFGLLLPIVLLVVFVLVGLIYAVMAAPTDEDRAGFAYLDSRMHDRQEPPVSQPAPAPAPNPASLRQFSRVNGSAFPTTRRQSLPRPDHLTPTPPAGEPVARPHPMEPGGLPRRVNGGAAPPTGRQSVPRPDPPVSPAVGDPSPRPNAGDAPGQVRRVSAIPSARRKSGPRSPQR
jgi:NO-binding membrane sensor protein with MHYT domain